MSAQCELQDSLELEQVITWHQLQTSAPDVSDTLYSDHISLHTQSSTQDTLMTKKTSRQHRQKSPKKIFVQV